MVTLITSLILAGAKIPALLHAYNNNQSGLYCIAVFENENFTEVWNHD